jgi:hypothetical protein
MQMIEIDMEMRYWYFLVNNNICQYADNFIQSNLVMHTCIFAYGRSKELNPLSWRCNHDALVFLLCHDDRSHCSITICTSNYDIVKCHSA